MDRANHRAVGFVLHSGNSPCSMRYAPKTKCTVHTLAKHFPKKLHIRIAHFHLPPAVGDIEQVNCCKLLGVIFQSNLKMDSHVHYIISQCAQRMYLLKLLRHQGMLGEQLSVVTYSIIVSRILYALPAWGGFLSAELTNKINALFRHLKQFGYTTCNNTVSKFDRHLWS